MKKIINQLVPRKLSVIVARSPRQFGFFQTLKLIFCYTLGVGRVKVRSKDLGVKLKIRPGTEDHYIIDKFTIQKKWDIDKDNIKKIIDAGAHIGIASIIFSKMYPNAIIISIEPEKENYEILKYNTKNISNIKIENSALWHENGVVKLEINEESWAHSISKSNNSNKNIKSKTVSRIAKDNGLKKIDVIKMDIEGAEREVLNNSKDWSDIVDCIIVEPHERLKKGCIKSIEDFSSRNEMNMEKAGEDYILYK